MDIMQLVLEASLVVKAVMLLLLLMSFYVWVLIFAKVLKVRKVVKMSLKFHRSFTQSSNLFNLYSHLKDKTDNKASPLQRIFLVGFREYVEQSKVQVADLTTRTLAIDLVRRAMQQKYNEEMEVLEDRAATLATIGSSAPYIGLFGTVFGIMDSFQALGAVKHATLSLVAPGITEALIATAMGLFVAIPAVIGYNRFATNSDRIAGQYEGFIDEFIRLIEKQLIIDSQRSQTTS